MVHADGEHIFGATLHTQVADAMPCDSFTATARAALLARARTSCLDCPRPCCSIIFCCNGEQAAAAEAPVAAELSAARPERP
eukprot:3481368-Pleurochrysis_carterae.AAC.1